MPQDQIAIAVSTSGSLPGVADHRDESTAGVPDFSFLIRRNHSVIQQRPPPLRPALEEMMAMDVEADLEDIRKPIPSMPVTPEMIEQLFTTSTILRSYGALFESKSHRTWQLTYKGRNVSVTFYPEVFDEMPSLRLMSFGEPLFEELLSRFNSWIGS